MPTALHQLARRKVAAGELPELPPSRTFGGESKGSVCDVCESSIDRADSEIEVQCARPERSFLMHVTCFNAWSNVVFERNGQAIAADPAKQRC